MFERATGRLISITRSYEVEHDVALLFPDKETTLHYFPSREAPTLIVRMRSLPGNLVLTALGASGVTSQLVLLRRESMPVVFPWLHTL
jgi:hypothetical protein